MAINVTTAEGRYNLSRLAGSDKIRDELESIFSQATSNPDLYQQFQTVLDRIAPASSFDNLSINRQSVLTARAVREFLNQQAFDKRLKASLEGLSPALQDELTTKLGALGDYKITAQQRGRLLTQFERQKANGRRKTIEENTNTAKIGIFNVKGTFANIWDTTLGRAVFAPLNRHVLQPIASGHETRMKQAGPFMKTLFWAGIAALGVAAVVATGGLVLAGSLPAIAGLAVGGIATAVAVNKARHAGTEFLDARADALVEQDARNEAFLAQNDAYQNGNPQRSQSLERHSIVATLSGVRESDFSTSGATLNVSSGQVVLSPEMYNRYHERVDVAFERSGNLKVAITDHTMSDQDIKQAIADVYADCTKGKEPESIMVRAGTTIFPTYNTTQDLLSTGDSFTGAAQEAKFAAEAAAQQAKIQTWNQEAQNTIQERVTGEFLDSVIVQGLKTNGDEVEYERIALEALNPQLSGNPVEEKIYKESLGQKIAQRLETYGIRDGVGSSPAYLAAKAITDNTLSLPEGQQATKLQQIAKAVELAAKSESLSSDVRAIAALRAAGLDAKNTAAMITAIREKEQGSVTLDDNVTTAVMALANDNEFDAGALKSALGAIEIPEAGTSTNEQAGVQGENHWGFDADEFSEVLSPSGRSA